MFVDRKKLKFMRNLMNICNDEQKYIEFIKSKSDGETNYLQLLYEYWETGNDIRNKLEYDYQANENKINSLQKTVYEI